MLILNIMADLVAYKRIKMISQLNPLERYGFGPGVVSH